MIKKISSKGTRKFLIVILVVALFLGAAFLIFQAIFSLDYQPHFYSVKGGKVFYGNEEITKADAKSFEILENFLYAKDSDNIYYEGLSINGADQRTFEVLSYIYSKDKNNIYLFEKKLTEANVNSFEAFCNDFGVDENNLFYFNKKLTSITSLNFAKYRKIYKECWGY